jgi:hypothetical protein
MMGDAVEFAVLSTARGGGSRLYIYMPKKPKVAFARMPTWWYGSLSVVVCRKVLLSNKYRYGTQRSSLASCQPRGAIAATLIGTRESLERCCTRLPIVRTVGPRLVEFPVESCLLSWLDFLLDERLDG